jgi:hypothetical protein
VQPLKDEHSLPDRGQVTFDSRFEGANLFAVYQDRSKPDTEYLLLMQSDLNTKGYNSFFYFAVGGLAPGRVYTFRVVNFSKKHSQFELGKKPWVFSRQRYLATGTGWAQ